MLNSQYYYLPSKEKSLEDINDFNDYFRIRREMVRPMFVVSGEERPFPNGLSVMAAKKMRG